MWEVVEHEIGRVRCYSMSVGTALLAYVREPAFPIDENFTPHPAGHGCDRQFPRHPRRTPAFREVVPRADVFQKHGENWDHAGVEQRWSCAGPSPAAPGAGVFSPTRSDAYDTCEVLL